MSTTASKIQGLNATGYSIDELGHYGYSGYLRSARLQPLTYDQCEMIKLGYKHYGFRPNVGGPLVAQFKGGHPEAQRRFKMLLITQRMMR